MLRLRCCCPLCLLLLNSIVPEATASTTREKSAAEAIGRMGLLEQLTTSIARDRVGIHAESVRLCAYVSFVRLLQSCCWLFNGSGRLLVGADAELLIMVTLTWVGRALVLAVIICRDLVAGGSPPA